MSKIQVLEEIEHVRKRPTMYIGSPDTPIHLVTEVLDNALDELVNGYSNTIEVNIDDEKHTITIKDWGRGIPIHKVKLPNGQQEDSIVTIATKLFSSAKFDRNAYDIAIGQNGVGLVVVNALSEYMIITTKLNNNKHREYYFKNGQFVEYKDIPKQNYSTKVEFKPNMKYFDKWLDSIEIANRLQLVKIHYPNARIIFNNIEIQNVDYETYVRSILSIDDNIPLFTVNGKHGKEAIEITFTYDLSPNAKIQPIIVGDVNLKLAEGRYISTLQSTIANIVDNIKPKSYVMTKQDALIRFRAYVSLLLKEPRFDSQNKTKCISDVKYLFNKVESQITKLYKQEDFLKLALEKINEYRILKEINRNKANNNTKRKVSSSNPVKMSKKPGTLYIVEGLSAAGTLTQIRDVNTEAVFPLKGKIINVETNSLDKVLNNKEVKYLLEVLGIDVSKPNNNLVFEKIAILSDPDADAHHINVLVLLLLYKFARQYIENGRVYVIIPPLYAIKKGKYIILHKSSTPPEDDNFIRYKGLGEMNPHELELVIRDDYFWLKVELEEGDEDIINLITNTNEKRKLLTLDKEPFDLLESHKAILV